MSSHGLSTCLVHGLLFHMAKVIITIGAIATVTWFAATATGVKKWESDKPLESLPARSKSGKKHGSFKIASSATKLE